LYKKFSNRLSTLPTYQNTNSNTQTAPVSNPIVSKENKSDPALDADLRSIGTNLNSLDSSLNATDQGLNQETVDPSE